MATHQWGEHTIDVRSPARIKGLRQLMVTVDGSQRLYSNIETWVNAWKAWEGAPGGWFPAPSIQFVVSDSGVTHDGRVEFEYSALTSHVRYRLLVQDDQIGSGEL